MLRRGSRIGEQVSAIVRRDVIALTSCGASSTLNGTLGYLSHFVRSFSIVRAGIRALTTITSLRSRDFRVFVVNGNRRVVDARDRRR